MTDTETKAETDILVALRNRYEKDGYTFVIHPSPDLVPEFLRGYQPDALALSDRGSVIIEIKGTREPSKNKTLAQIAERVAKFPNWRFEVFYAGAFQRPVYSKPTRQAIQELIREVQQLRQNGLFRAAVVMGWATLEALARALHVGDEKTFRPTMPSETIEWLTQAGYIDSSTSRLLRHMIKTRNALVHGVPNVDVVPSEMEVLLGTLDNLFQQVE